ncbi:maintenance of telomere capping protein 1 [Peziza echinospora]|nr:maintenance of telomere capping protein 1 [Peziza echinospora]
MSQPDDVLDALFEGIDANPTTSKPSSTATPSASAATSTPPSSSKKSENDILAEFDLLTAERHPPSRPSTPRVRKSTEMRRPGSHVTDSPGGRRSGELPRPSGYGIGTGIVRRDSNDVVPKHGTPVEASTPTPTFAVTSPFGATTAAPAAPASGSGGGWWGSVWSTASTAIKTAEGVYHDIQQQQQQNLQEQQQRNPQQASTSRSNPLSTTSSWLTQNLPPISLDTVQKLTSDIRSRALPTLSDFLHTIAPPISAHEQLRIHITHDTLNYPIFDTLVYAVFDRVMQQVEGGDLLVVQRGSESKARTSLGGGIGSGSGQWYRDSGERKLNAHIGAIEDAVKLARAAAEAYSLEYDQAHPADPHQAENPDNPTRKSDIFLAIVPVTTPIPEYLKSAPRQRDDGGEGGGDDEEEEDEEKDQTVFALYLLDPTHRITFATVSQPLPERWLTWLDSDSQHLFSGVAGGGGGFDPREWVVEWLEETVALAVGVVAQRYVAKRMNVGAGVELVDRIKARQDMGSVGEEARAI